MYTREIKREIPSDTLDCEGSLAIHDSFRSYIVPNHDYTSLLCFIVFQGCHDHVKESSFLKPKQGEMLVVIRADQGPVTIHVPNFQNFGTVEASAYQPISLCQQHPGPVIAERNQTPSNVGHLSTRLIL
jgi:hypothetical protein